MRIISLYRTGAQSIQEIKISLKIKMNVIFYVKHRGSGRHSQEMYERPSLNLHSECKTLHAASWQQINPLKSSVFSASSVDVLYSRKDLNLQILILN